MTRWVALLRGVNVGGSNRLAMAELRTTFESIGCTAVATYIQSGNIVFDTTDRQPEIELVTAIASIIADRHGLTVPVVVRSAAEMATTATSHPAAAADLDPRFLHVAFLDREPGADAVESVAVDRFAPDEWSLVGRELYLTYPNGSARSTMTIDRFERAWDVIATARNLNTVRKLVAMSTTS